MEVEYNPAVAWAEYSFAEAEGAAHSLVAIEEQRSPAGVEEVVKYSSVMASEEHSPVEELADNFCSVE